MLYEVITTMPVVGLGYMLIFAAISSLALTPRTGKHALNIGQAS